MLLCHRTDLSLHVIHLDHQTRGDESTADAQFVRGLAERLKLPCTVAIRSDVEATMSDLPGNTSSRYRAARIALFRKVVDEANLSGVILAHHADDQAETVLHRLLRGSGPAGLAAMEREANIGGLKILRPLLPVRRETLRTFLATLDQSWREDASNDSDDYLRNRLRRLLAKEPAIAAPLLILGDACGELRNWIRSTSTVLAPEFRTPALTDQPTMLAAESARTWLVDRGLPPDQTSPAVILRLIQMATDAATPPKVHFPGGMIVRRRGAMIAIQ
jgi:tRNA(Ile)-lysidine synthetase-like protein